MQAPDIDSDLFVEVLGILVNVDVPSCDWASLIAKHDLLNLLAGQILLLSLNPYAFKHLSSADDAAQCACCGAPFAHHADDVVALDAVAQSCVVSKQSPLPILCHPLV